MAVIQETLSVRIARLLHCATEVKADVPIIDADALRLYEALAENPLTAKRLARMMGTDLRCVSEWLVMQSACGQLQYDEASQRFWMLDGQAREIARAPQRAFMKDAFAIWRSRRD